jgi:hypothetical protein
MVLHWKSGDCGHGLGRQHKGTKYNEKNNHLQCKKCNGFEGGRSDAYKVEMDKRYGDGTWDSMRINSKVTHKMADFEWDYLTDEYYNKVDLLAKEKGVTGLTAMNQWRMRKKEQ